jgi:hypothetical protein
VAKKRGISMEKLLNDVEQHKLQQTTEEEW